MIAIILLVIFFWPLAWIPCVMDDCFGECPLPVLAALPQGLPTVKSAACVEHSASTVTSSARHNLNHVRDVSAEAQQRPIYGFPNGMQQSMPVAQPVHGIPVPPNQGPAPGSDYPKADKPPPV